MKRSIGYGCRTPGDWNRPADEDSWQLMLQKVLNTFTVFCSCAGDAGRGRRLKTTHDGPVGPKVPVRVDAYATLVS